MFIRQLDQLILRYANLDSCKNFYWFMEDGGIKGFHGSFVIIFIKIVQWYSLSFFSPSIMDIQDKFILLNGYLYCLMLFGRVGPV